MLGFWSRYEFAKSRGAMHSHGLLWPVAPTRSPTPEGEQMRAALARIGIILDSLRAAVTRASRGKILWTPRRLLTPRLSAPPMTSQGFSNKTLGFRPTSIVPQRWRSAHIRGARQCHRAQLARAAA